MDPDLVGCLRALARRWRELDSRGATAYEMAQFYLRWHLAGAPDGCYPWDPAFAEDLTKFELEDG